MDSVALIKEFPFITGNDPHSFARYTLQNRLPFIIDQIITDNAFDDVTVRRLHDLKEGIKSDKIPDLSFSYSESSQSQDLLERFSGKSWSELPFFYAEVFFYAEILEIIQFSERQVDPFLKQKQRDLAESLPKLEQIVDSADEVMNSRLKTEVKVAELLKITLWGNKSDLSQLKVQRELSDKDHTLLDHSRSIAIFLAKQTKQLDIVLDNSGVELFTDLVLAVRLLQMEVVEKCILHAKSNPTFVSDATIADVMGLVAHLDECGRGSLVSFAQDVKSWINSDRLEVHDHQFWNAPLHFYELAPDLDEDLSKSDLIIFKGDLNYRRVFGDRKIPVQSDPELFARYLPSRSVAVRILKSELMLGMEKSEAVELSTTDKSWMSNGKYGIIQLLKR